MTCRHITLVTDIDESLVNIVKVHVYYSVSLAHLLVQKRILGLTLYIQFCYCCR